MQGGIGNGALVFSWTGQGPGIEAARRGHDVVMCPAQNAYFDLAHSDDPDDWGAAWAGFVPLEKTVELGPGAKRGRGYRAAYRRGARPVSGANSPPKTPRPNR